MNKYAEFSKPRPAIENRRCLTKANYRTEDRAELVAAHINSMLGVEQRPYHCPMCLRWHLTSKPQAMFSAISQPASRAHAGIGA